MANEALEADVEHLRAKESELAEIEIA